MQRWTASAAYDPDAGAWPVDYSEAERDRQREAGSRALQDFQAALSRGETVFDFGSGVYRIDKSFVAADLDGFEFRAAGAEIIMEGTHMPTHFRILGCKGMKFRGPLILDSSPFGFSQGKIIENDCREGEPSYVTMQLDPGYPYPVKGHRITCFEPATGTMIAHYQDVVEGVADAGDGRVRLEMGPDFVRLYKRETEAAVAVGNLICVENTENMGGGFEIRDSFGLAISDVSVHCFCLLWALQLGGDVSLERYFACRRPGTNRLMGGGFPAFGMHGGSLTIRDCEIGHNFDDLTDVGSDLGFAFKQVGPRQLYVGLTNNPPVPGRRLAFYDATTLEPTGEATVTASVRTEDERITHEFWAALKGIKVLTWDCVPCLVTLDRDFDARGLQMVDLPETRPDFMTVTDSYLHDSLAAGISLKGARKIVVKRNVVERAGYRGIGAGFDPYWCASIPGSMPDQAVGISRTQKLPALTVLQTYIRTQWEGGVPSDIIVEDNFVVDTPYNLPDETPAINIYVDAAPDMRLKATGCPMRGVRIRNNTVVRPRTAGIGVAFARDIDVSGNAIEQPMAARLQTAWGAARNYPRAAAVLLDTVRAAAVTDNRFVAREPQLIPNAICATEQTDRRQIKLAKNTMSYVGGPPMALPDAFSHRVSCYDDAVALSGSWQRRDDPDCYRGVCAECSEQGAKAHFTWTGSRARVFATLSSASGAADVLIDGRQAATFDAADLPPGFDSLVRPAGLADQLVFDSGALPAGRHELDVVVGRRRAPDAGARLILCGFDCVAAVPPAGRPPAS